MEYADFMQFPVELPAGFVSKAASLGINPVDVSEQFVRGTGAGGQKINKTNSCVLLRHGPSGVEVRCQKHREQSANRLSAWKLLILKIEEKMRGSTSARQQKMFKLRKQKQRRSRKAQRKVLEMKKHRGLFKALRRAVTGA